MNETPDYNESTTASWALVLCFVLAGSMFAYAVFAYKTHIKEIEAMERMDQRIHILETQMMNVGVTNKIK